MSSSTMLEPCALTKPMSLGVISAVHKAPAIEFSIAWRKLAVGRAAWRPSCRVPRREARIRAPRSCRLRVSSTKMAAPSPYTTPSRSASKGRKTLRPDRRCGTRRCRTRGRSSDRHAAGCPNRPRASHRPSRDERWTPLPTMPRATRPQPSRLYCSVPAGPVQCRLARRHVRQVLEHPQAGTFAS